MIAFGESFIGMLKENNLTLMEYFVLYCHVYDKEKLITEYCTRFQDFKVVPVCNKLVEKEMLLRIIVNTEKYVSTEKGDDFIRSLVDSFADQKSDNPFLGEEDITLIADNIYNDEFEKFLAVYPIEVLRDNGTKSYLKEGSKDIKELYVKIVTGSRATPDELQAAIEYYVARHTNTGNLSYMKTLKNWFTQEIWRDVLSYINSPNYKPEKAVNYGGKVE